ncbi:carbamoyltransferase C-terminal domain-containing protein [Kitasatospora sp. GP82]|uniref:carbamoyltransferase C-terminal domain-containing protein n=1 Tax=Kitasatospora sp. GP82 TaxID=3035089 RepID=UPI0024762713|nr:carbamoyltransferase C-terminal domain-containing protein [Kitasatospora sp. GP82]MDH6128120.1 carbamoyltransferase [Kitasatospora sp. GP82]
MPHSRALRTGRILGINYNGMHDSAICLLDEAGELTYAVSEERFSRIKQDGRFPRCALAGVDLAGVEAIGVPYLDPCPDRLATDQHLAKLLHPVPPGWDVAPFAPVWRQRLESLDRPLHFFDHHAMHAYTGLVLSRYPEAFALTCDYGAYTCPITMGVHHVRRGEVTRLAAASVTEHRALAGLYSDVTALLGFTPGRHEGKVTGLAAHGRPSADCRERVWDLHRRIQDSEHRLYDWIGFLEEEGRAPACETNRYLARSYRSELPYDDSDIARAAQDLLEEKLLAVADWLATEHGRRLPLLLSGGVFANVRANQRLASLGFPAVFVAPPMGDDGLCIGAAAAAHDALAKDAGSAMDLAVAMAKPTVRPTSMAVGPVPTRDLDSIGDLLDRLGVVHRTPQPAALADHLAAVLAQGRTVALVRGAQEFGPRALGRRSILSAATDPGVNDRLNSKLARTEFMPFAPVLRIERLPDVCDLDGLTSDVSDCLPFMTICLPVRRAVAAAAPAVVHIDGTARPQVVSRDQDPFLHQVLADYEERTGIPVLINTSFNIHDEPLVSSAEDAIAAFLTAELDLLCLEGHLVELAENRRLVSLTRLLSRNSHGHLKKRHTALSEVFGRLSVHGPGRFSAFAPD